jgi:hypothetical protein
MAIDGYIYEVFYTALRVEPSRDRTLPTVAESCIACSFKNAAVL